eukprot:827489-Rhodomonas_salina.1
MRAAERAAREAAEAEGGTQRGPSFGRRRLSQCVFPGPSQSPEGGLSTEEAQPFNIKDPSTWRE